MPPKRDYSNYQTHPPVDPHNALLCLVCQVHYTARDRMVCELCDGRVTASLRRWASGISAPKKDIKWAGSPSSHDRYRVHPVSLSPESLDRFGL